MPRSYGEFTTTLRELKLKEGLIVLPTFGAWHVELWLHVVT